MTNLQLLPITTTFGRWLRRIKRLTDKPATDQWLIIKVTVLLAITRALILCLSFRRLEKYLGVRTRESNKHVTTEQYEYADRVRSAINSVAPHTFWESNCFPCAITAKILLRQQDINSTLYLGVSFNSTQSEMKAHAWLRCGSTYITGGNGQTDYRIIATFAD